LASPTQPRALPFAARATGLDALRERTERDREVERPHASLGICHERLVMTLKLRLPLSASLGLALSALSLLRREAARSLRLGGDVQPADERVQALLDRPAFLVAPGRWAVYVLDADPQAPVAEVGVRHLPTVVARALRGLGVERRGPRPLEQVEPDAL